MGIKISALPAAGAADSAMQFEVNNAGTSERLTLAQMFALSMAAVTVDTPLLNMAQTWNAGAVTFTGWKLNVTDTASAAASKLLDLQVGGSTKFNITKTGAIRIGDVTLYDTAGSQLCRFGAGRLTAPAELAISASGATSAPDLFLKREAANVLGLANGTNAQEFRLYDTYTDASNYRRLNFRFSSGDCFIETDAAGTGVAGQGQLMLKTSTGKQIRFYIGATQAWQMNSSGHLVAGADNTYDLGASGATRPRNLYLAGGLTHGSATLVATTTALTNGAAASAGTLTNAPVAGNPTKWIPINDNGTTRYIPAW